MRNIIICVNLEGTSFQRGLIQTGSWRINKHRPQIQHQKIIDVQPDIQGYPDMAAGKLAKIGFVTILVSRLEKPDSCYQEEFLNAVFYFNVERKMTELFRRIVAICVIDGIAELRVEMFMLFVSGQQTSAPKNKNSRLRS